MTAVSAYFIEDEEEGRGEEEGANGGIKPKKRRTSNLFLVVNFGPC